MDDTCSRCGHDWHGLACQHSTLVRELMLRQERCACSSSLEQAS